MDTEDPRRMARARRAAAKRNPRKAAQHLKSAELLEQQPRVFARNYKTAADAPNFGREELGRVHSIRCSRQAEIQAWKDKILGVENVSKLI